MNDLEYILRAQAALGADDHLLKLGSIRVAPVGATSRPQGEAPAAATQPPKSERH